MHGHQSSNGRGVGGSRPVRSAGPDAARGHRDSARNGHPTQPAHPIHSQSGHSNPLGRSNSRNAYYLGSKKAMRSGNARGHKQRGTYLNHRGLNGSVRGRRNMRGRSSTAETARRYLPVLACVAVLLVALWGIGSLAQGGLSLFGKMELTATQKVFASGTGKRFKRAAASAIKNSKTSDTVVLDAGRTTKTGDGKVTFSAVGDNLANQNIIDLANSNTGSTTDGEYDFTPFYKDIKKKVRSFDISFVNQETTLGGPDAYGYNGYPSYNTPDSMADAVADVGWRVVNTNSNHTYDTWTSSIKHAQSVWAKKSSQLVTIGSYKNKADRNKIRVVECNGLRFAFLSYSYGQNGYTQDQLPNKYYAVPYETEQMQKDVAAARKVSDAVVVYMHWGEEYQNDPSETQKTQAQELADAGVDLVIGSHVHVIQPMEWVSGEGGKTLVVYGLGDFLSGYSKPDCILSGMFSCKFTRVKGGSTGKGKKLRHVKISKVVWTPLVEHWADGQDSVRMVKGYTEEEAAANELLKRQSDPLTWCKEKTQEVIGNDFTIDM